MRFKVGDRVRYISDKGAMPKGAYGTIRKIERAGGYQVAYVVRQDNKVRKGYCYYAAERNLEAALEDINETEEKGKMNIEAIQTFATRAKTLRKERGLSQTELAAKLGISRDSVNLYESASRFPDITALVRYASFFSVTSAYLLGLSENRTIPEKLKDGWEIKIASDGDETTAKLYENGNAVREATVTRYYKDTYSTEVAAKEAVSKLFAPRGFTGKAMFVGDPEGYNDGFTYGKIYEFINGYCIDNDGDRRPATGYPTTLEIGNWGSGDFIKVVE